MPTQPPTRSNPPPAAPARPPVQPPPSQERHPANPPAYPPNRPQGAAQYTREPAAGRETVGAAHTYPPGSPQQARMERDNEGPDPQEAKMRPYELAAQVADDEVVVTAAQEQRARSELYQERGVEVVKAEGDDRDPEDRPRTVAGVRRTLVEDDQPAQRSTPEARGYQHRSAP